MTLLLYNWITYLLSRGYKIIGTFSPKLKESIKIRDSQLPALTKWRNKIKDQKLIQVHCASLGELEMSLPAVEVIKKNHPNTSFLFSFFSKSGYDYFQPKNGDAKCYLPLEESKKINAFLNTLRPNMVLFIKYEFWFKYLNALSENDIPYCFLNLSFQKAPYLFRFNGFLNILKNSLLLGCTNQKTCDLLNNQSCAQTHSHTDLRYFRATKIASEERSIPDSFEVFLNNKPLIIFGSIGLEDEPIMTPFIQNHDEYNYIIAPHKLEENYIQTLSNKFNGTGRWSNQSISEDTNVIILDTIGDLKYLYKYASFSYIGGGFKVGLHNIIEAAIFNGYILFGPNHSKDIEAQSLMNKKQAFSIKNFEEFEFNITQLNTQPTKAITSRDFSITQSYSSFSELLNNHISKYL